MGLAVALMSLQTIDVRLHLPQVCFMSMRLVEWTVEPKTSDGPGQLIGYVFTHQRQHGSDPRFQGAVLPSDLLGQDAFSSTPGVLGAV